MHTCKLPRHCVATVPSDSLDLLTFQLLVAKEEILPKMFYQVDVLYPAALSPHVVQQHLCSDFSHA